MHSTAWRNAAACSWSGSRSRRQWTTRTTRPPARTARARATRSPSSGDGNQCEGGGSEPQNGVEPDADADLTSGEGGALSGNQVDVDAAAPVDASGNQVTVIGDGNTSGGSSGGGCGSTDSSTGGDADGADGAVGGDTTSGEDGVGSGNQLTLDPDAQVDASGNQLTLDPVARVDADENQVTVLGNDNDRGEPGEDDDGIGGSGDPDGDGATDDPGNQGDDPDGQVRGLGAGTPGSPGTAALGALPVDAAQVRAALPQTGAAHGPGLTLLGLAMLLAGLVLASRRRGVVGT